MCLTRPPYFAITFSGVEKGRGGGAVQQVGTQIPIDKNLLSASVKESCGANHSLPELNILPLIIHLVMYMIKLD